MLNVDPASTTTAEPKPLSRSGTLRRYRYSVFAMFGPLFECFALWLIVFGLAAAVLAVKTRPINPDHLTLAGLACVVGFLAHSWRFLARLFDRSVQLELSDEGLWAKELAGGMIPWSVVTKITGYVDRGESGAGRPLRLSLQLIPSATLLVQTSDRGLVGVDVSHIDPGLRRVLPEAQRFHQGVVRPATESEPTRLG